MERRGSTMRWEHERVRRIIFLTPAFSRDQSTRESTDRPPTAGITPEHYNPKAIPRKHIIAQIPHVGRIVAPLASPSCDCNVQPISRAPLNRALILARTLVRGERRSYSSDASHYLCIFRSSPLQCGKKFHNDSGGLFSS